MKALLPGVLGLCVTAVAQDAHPDRLLGEVRDLEGLPWVGAEVLVVHRSRFGSRDPLDQDVLRTRTDDRGRFRLRIRPGRPHAVWAQDLDGQARRITRVLQDVQARQALLLHELPPRLERTLELEGFGYWRQYGELQFLATTEDVRPAYTRTLDETVPDRVTLPLMPGDRVRVEAWLTEGPCVARLLVDQEARARQSYFPAAGVEHRLLYVGDGRRHLDRAELFVGSAENGVWRPVLAPAFTSPGIVEFTLPRLDLPRPGGRGWHTDLRVVVPGEADILLRDDLWLIGQPLEERRRMGRVDGVAHVLPTSSLAGRVLLQDGEPAADAQICLYEKARMSSLQGKRIVPPVGPPPRVYRTDAEGRFEIPDVRGSYRLTFLPGVVDRAFGDARCPDCGEWILLSEAAVTDGGKLGDLSLDRLRFLEVEVTHTGGTPVDRPIVLIAELEESESEGAFRPVEVHADTLGHTRLLVPPDKDILVVARSGRRVACTVVGASSKHGFENVEPILVVMDGPVVHGMVATASGEPCAGAEITVTGLQSETEEPLDRLVAQALMSCYRYWRTYPSAETDERGNYSFQLPVSGLEARLSASWKADGRLWTGASRFEPVEKTGARVDIDVQELQGR